VFEGYKCNRELDSWLYGSIHTQGCIQKFPEWFDNEMYAYDNKHSLRSNTKDYGGKTHKTDLQNRDTTAPSGRELYHLQFLLQVASPETFGYILCVCVCVCAVLFSYREMYRYSWLERLGGCDAS
jgi:hypothetical protein